MTARATLPAPGAGERRAAARGVAWGGVESAVAALVGLSLTPIVIRHAGIEGLGLWGAAWSLAHTASLLDLGVGAAYGRFTAAALARNDLEDLNGLLAAGIGFHLVLSLLIGLPALLLGPALLERMAGDSACRTDAGVVLTCTLLTVLLRGTLSVYRGVVAGAQRADLLARLGALFSVVEGCAGAVALIAGFGLRGMAVVSLGSAAAASLAEGLLAHRLSPGLRLLPFLARRDQYRRVLAFGSQVQATRAFEVLASHVPRLVLAAGPGLAGAGAYDLGARLAAVVPLLASLPLRVITPLAAHLEARGDRSGLHALLARSTRYVALLALPAAALVLLEAETILLAWTGRPAPSHAALAAQCLAGAAAIALVASPLRLIARGAGRAGLEAASTGLGTTLHLGLAMAWAPRWGAAGVALAAVPGAVIAFLFLAAVVARRGAGLDPRVAGRALFGPAAAAAGIVVSGLLLAQIPWLAHASAGETRVDALSFLARRLPVLGAVFLAVAGPLGAIRAEDVLLLREAAGGASPGGAAR